VRGPLPEAWHSNPVTVDRLVVDGARVITADVVAEKNRYHHDSDKLAGALMRLYLGREPAASPNVASNGHSEEAEELAAAGPSS
jgi:hypothetical protein